MAYSITNLTRRSGVCHVALGSLLLIEGFMMLRAIGLLRSVVFLGWLCAALATTSVVTAVWAFQLSSAVSAMAAKVATMADTHRKQLTKEVTRTKAKARLRRAVVAVPIAGIAATAYFEEQDFQEWLIENPDGTRREYACSIATLSAEVVDEVLQELPKTLRPAPETVLSIVPECS